MSSDTPPLSRSKLVEEVALLKVELNALTTESRALREKVSQTDKQRARTESEIKRREELLGVGREHISVSDHAVVRYLERRYGFDFEDVRDEILTPAVRSAVNAGATGVSVEGGTFKIQGRTIVTYMRTK